MLDAVKDHNMAASASPEGLLSPREQTHSAVSQDFPVETLYRLGSNTHPRGFRPVKFYPVFDSIYTVNKSREQPFTAISSHADAAEASVGASSLPLTLILIQYVFFTSGLVT